MNINFEKDRAENEVRNYASGIKPHAERAAAATQAGSKGVFALDISGTALDNNAYEEQGKTIEEVMQEAGQTDVATQKDYMIVMSNVMSDEDFAKLQEEGYHPGNTDIETVVTIVDEIKAALVKGGSDIAGYTDDLDAETLTEITGSAAYAEEILKQFHEYDIPVTKENVEEVMKARDMAEQLSEPSDGTIKYMIRNHMEPTIDNIYRAQYSALADADRQGRGYYQDAAGYYAKKAEDFNWQQLQPQMEKVIEQAGLLVSGETLEDAKWLVEKGIPLTAESIDALYELKNLQIPRTAEEIVSAAAAAIADGKKAKEANVADSESALEKAAGYMEDVQSATGEAVDKAAAEGNKLNLRIIKACQLQLNMHARAERYAVSHGGRRMLEEVRLQMTVEANLRLIKSGFSIDTAPLEELVDALKTVNRQTEEKLFGEGDVEGAGDRYSLYKNTLSTVRELSGMPAALVGKFSFRSRIQVSAASASAGGGAFTLKAAYEEGSALRLAYEKAGESYEALKTVPREELGDTIKKAFQNVDDLLKEIAMEQSEANRRAVRILGYNRMEVSVENVEAVKTTDLTIRRVLSKMSPAATMQMIKDGVNPLSMDMQDLENYLDSQDRNPEQEFEKYSKYLYKLEKNHAVTEGEKEAYIGIYRLFRQLEKTDGAAIGVLMQQGMEPTLKNLLTAVRTNKNRGMDIKVDDSFGGVRASGRNKSISEQIEGNIMVRYYEKLVHGIYDGLDGGKMNEVPADGDVSLEQFAQSLQEAQPDKESESAYVKQQAMQFRQDMDAEEAVIKELQDYGQPVTANNLLAAGLLMKERGKAAAKLYELAEGSGSKELFEKAMAKVQENMTDAEAAQEAYGELTETYNDIIEAAVFGQGIDGKIDMQEIGSLYKQIFLTRGMAREENYEVPVKIGEEVTSVNLKIIHKGGGNGKVAAAMETESYGKVAAQFYVSVRKEGGYQVSGCIVCGNRKAADSLGQSGETLKKMFRNADIETVSMNVIFNEGLDVAMIARMSGREDVAGAEDARQTEAAARKTVPTKKLYDAAKMFIEYIQERQRD